MVRIYLETLIHAPCKRCFDLSRSIELHKLSTQKTQEEAMAGTTTGLIELGEWVTWRARHFGVMQKMTVKITALESPHFFQDQMQRGIFKSFLHNHSFESQADEQTLMKDELFFEAPLGLLGRAVERWVLKKYLTRFLAERNSLIKAVAESDQWRDVPGME
ncbi:MAG: SRPBCC family protein [Bacteroidota bacterium]